MIYDHNHLNFFLIGHSEDKPSLRYNRVNVITGGNVYNNPNINVNVNVNRQGMSVYLIMFL